MQNITTTFKLPSSICQKLLEQVVKDGYGLRGKSRWVKEAVENFLKMPNHPELVTIADDIEKLDKSICIRIPASFANKIEKTVTEIRKIYPNLEGVRSNIFRASIMQRLILHTDGII
jgi:hypothetical protein